VALQGQADRAVVVITGLAPGMQLSAGNSVGVDTWKVLATDLGDTWIGPPENFIGSVELVAELRLSDNKISDRQAVQIHWAPATSPTAIVPQSAERPIAEAQTIAVGPAQKRGDSPETSAKPQFYLQSAQSQSEIKIIAAAPSLPTLSQNHFDQEAVKAASADSVTYAQEQSQPGEVQTLQSTSRTQVPNHFDQKEIAATRPNLPSAAPGQLAQDETATVPMISPAPAQNRSAQDIVAVSAGLPTPAQNNLDQEIIAAQPILASALPKKLVMAEPRPSPTSVQYQRDDVRTAPTVPKSQGLDPEQTTAPTSSPPQRALDNEEIAVLLRRGKDLIASGDIAAARLVLQRAADANNPEAALALGATYDPLVLRELRVYGLAADPVMARTWYEKARAFGSVAATRRLEKLTTEAR
jgi:TPR repeat protein